VRYDEAKGYGFIAPDDGTEDIFFLRGELPHELAQCTRRDQLIDARVEFEVREKSEGKLRAHRLALIVPPPGFQAPRGPDRGSSSGSGGRRIIGRILRFDRQRGYGFIQGHNEPDDVFFLPGALPPDLAERILHEDLTNMEVEVEAVPNNKDGKPRAVRITRYHGRMPPPPGPSSAGGPGPSSSHGHQPVGSGTVVSFDTAKGFGFIRPDIPGEDIFYLRSELPPEIREGSPQQIIDCRLEFEVKTMPDGKLRAQRCALLPPGGPPMSMGHGGPMVPPPLPPGMRMGRIQQFNRQKGYGFISVPDDADVFFLPSALPKELKDGNDNLAGVDVAFEFFINEEGKPRARNIQPVRPGHMPPPPPGHMPPPPMMGMMMMGMPPHHMGVPPHHMGMPPPHMGMPPPHMGVPPPPPMDQSGPRFRPGEVFTGSIVRFNSTKGYGFLTPDELDEDIFFLRSEMPAEIQGMQRQEEVVQKRVEFEVRTMPDGKLRAQRMKLLSDQGGGGGDRRRRGRDDGDQPLPPLDPGLVDEMADFLATQGGGSDFGRFCSRFPRVRKTQLEEHFDIFSLERGQRIELPEGHPSRRDDEGRPDDDFVDSRPDGDGAEEQPRAEGDDDVPPDEPAIPPGPGCTPLGVIRSYDPAKGFGFVRADGLDAEIFFPYSALPESFHAKRRSEMPELEGVEVSVELGPDGNRGPRANRVNLLLKWHAGDSCWLLKRR